MDSNNLLKKNYSVVKRIGPILAAFVLLIGVAGAGAALTRDEIPPEIGDADQEVELRVGSIQGERGTTSMEDEHSPSPQNSSTQSEPVTPETSSAQSTGSQPQPVTPAVPQPQVAPIQPAPHPAQTLDDDDWDDDRGDDDWDDDRGDDDWDDDGDDD